MNIPVRATTGSPGALCLGSGSRGYLVGIYQNYYQISDQKKSFFRARFQTWPLGRNYVIITQIRAQTKKISSNAFRIRLFLFLSNSFGLGTINTFIRSRSSLKSHPILDQNGQSVYTFSDQKRPQKPTLKSGTYLYGLNKGVPPGPGGIVRHCLL